VETPTVARRYAGRLGCIFVETVEAFYAGQAVEEGVLDAKSGSVTVIVAGQLALEVLEGQVDPDPGRVLP